jgi:hypothetical protein
VVTPSQQQSRASAAKTWVIFTGATGAILVSHSVSGVSRTGTGLDTVTFNHPVFLSQLRLLGDGPEFWGIHQRLWRIDRCDGGFSLFGFSEQRYCRARSYCWHARLLRWPLSVAGAVISIEGVYESIQLPRIRGR